MCCDATPESSTAIMAVVGILAALAGVLLAGVLLIGQRLWRLRVRGALEHLAAEVDELHERLDSTEWAHR